MYDFTGGILTAGKTISVSVDVYERLKASKLMERETFSSVIERLLDGNDTSKAKA